MDHNAESSVARQATFDTDPDRARIKRGTLKLPVIQAEDEKHPPVDSKHKTGEIPKAEAKSKQTDTKEKAVHNSHSVKQGKVTAGGNHVDSSESTKPSYKTAGKTDNNASTNKKESKGNNKKSEQHELNSSEKQKKPSVTKESNQTNSSHLKEPETAKAKGDIQKASVLKDLNSKRNRSPEKDTSPHKVAVKASEKEKEDKNKITPNKRHQDKKDAIESANNRNKSPQKRDLSPTKKETLKVDENEVNKNKPLNTKGRQDLKDSNAKDSLKKDIGQQKQIANGSSKAHSSEDSTSKLHTNKQVAKKTEAVKSDKSDHTKRDQSPGKRHQSPSKVDTPAELVSLKNLKNKHNLGQSGVTATTALYNRTNDIPVVKRGRSPEKKVSTAQKDEKDVNESTHHKEIKSNKHVVKSPVSIKDNKNEYHNITKDEASLSVPDSKSNTNSKFPTNNAPVETKLNDSKHTVTSSKQVHIEQEHSGDKPVAKAKSNSNDNADLTTAFALLVSEGAKAASENSEIKANSPKGQDPDSSLNNESDDTVPELENLKKHSVHTKSRDKKVNSGEFVRETYVITPSPTKLDRSKDYDTFETKKQPISSDLIVEAIDIDSRPLNKGQKMQGRESFEQVFAERNTLLKAEHAYRKRIKQLEDEANGFLKVIEDLTSENKLLRNRVDVLENQIKHQGDANAFNRITELEKDKSNLESRIKQLEHLANSNANTDGKSDRMQTEIRELKAQVIKLQTDNQTLNEENIKIKSENYGNLKKLHSVEAEKKSLATSVTVVESMKIDKIQGLKNDQAHTNKENAELRKKHAELEKKISVLENEKSSLAEGLAQKKKELKEILTVMKDENKFENELKELQIQITQLQNEKKEIQTSHTKELRILNDKLVKTTSDLDKTTKEAYELKIKVDETEKENDTLKKDNASLTKHEQSLETEIKNLKNEIERLKKDSAQSQEKYDKLLTETKTESSNLKTAKQNAEDLNRDLQKIVSDKENQISKLVSQLDAAQKEKETENQSLQTDQEQLKTENERLKVFESNMGRMESELKHVVGKLEDAELKKKQLSIQLQDKGFEISNLEQQVFELNMKLDGNARRVSQLDKDKRELENDRREWDVKKEKVNDIEASNKRLIEENKRLRSQLDISSYSSEYRPPEAAIERDRPVVEAWVNESNPKQTQQAVYVQKEKKRVQIVPPPVSQKKRPSYSKSNPIKSSKSQGYKSEPVKPSVKSSRSLEDLRRTPDNRTPESEPSLPELQKETRLTFGVGGYVGYREIHRNRIKALQKKVY